MSEILLKIKGGKKARVALFLLLDKALSVAQDDDNETPEAIALLRQLVDQLR